VVFDSLSFVCWLQLHLDLEEDLQICWPPLTAPPQLYICTRGQPMESAFTEARNSKLSESWGSSKGCVLGCTLVRMIGRPTSVDGLSTTVEGVVLSMENLGRTQGQWKWVHSGRSGPVLGDAFHYPGEPLQGPVKILQVQPYEPECPRT
jgi:hypothetical protein